MQDMAKRANATSFGGERGNKPKPGPGHPGSVYVKRMRMLAELAAKAKRFETVIKDPESPIDDFCKVFDRVSDRAFGKPAQSSSVELTGDGGGPVQIVMIGGKQVSF